MSLVIGAAGAVGKRLIGSLGARGDHVVCALRRTPLPDHLQILVTAQVMNVDVRDVNTLRHVFKQHPEIHTVWNMAAPLSVETAKDPSVAYKVTVGGMENILTAMHEANVKRIIFTDSIGSMGGSSPRTNCPARWLVENPTQDPGSDYGLQKRGCRELMTKFAQDKGGDARFAVLPGVLHTEAVWGQGTTEYALDALKAAAEEKAYECPIDPDVQLPMVFADDLARGLMALFDAPPEQLTEPGRGYNIPGFSFSANELFAEIRKHHPEFSTSTKLDPNMDKFAKLWPDDLSTAESKRDLGYSPAFHLPKTVATILRAHRLRKLPDAMPADPTSVETAP